jgi:hypothetical protein
MPKGPLRLTDDQLAAVLRGAAGYGKSTLAKANSTLFSAVRRQIVEYDLPVRKGAWASARRAGRSHRENI